MHPTMLKLQDAQLSCVCHLLIMQHLQSEVEVAQVTSLESQSP